MQLSIASKLAPRYPLSTGRALAKRPLNRQLCLRACMEPSRRYARPLLIDNYDSYSYNLYQILAEVYGGENGSSKLYSSAPSAN
jgi:hypothetical protein